MNIKDKISQHKYVKTIQNKWKEMTDSSEKPEVWEPPKESDDSIHDEFEQIYTELQYHEEVLKKQLTAYGTGESGIRMSDIDQTFSSIKKYIRESRVLAIKKLSEMEKEQND